MSEPLLGEIRPFGFGWAPRGWALCNGQLLSISQNTALFSLLGTTYGGDGRVTFGLPDLRGRTPLNQGNGPGLTPRTIGEVFGEESHSLLTNEMPMHNHMINASQAADSTDPTGHFQGNDSRAGLSIYNTTSDGTRMNPSMISLTGNTLPHDNMQPYLCISFCIAVEGVFPSRN